MSFLFHVSDSTPAGIGGIDAYTKIMLHGDEAPLVDSELTPKSLTLNGSIARSATESKFGGYSIYVNGTNQTVTVPDSVDWDFGTGDFTIDFWFKVESYTAWDIVMHCGNGSANANTNWHISFNDSNQIRLTIFETDTPVSVINTTNVVTDGLWHHYAGVRSGNSTMVAIDGTFGSTADVTGKDVRFLSSSIVTVGAIWGGIQAPNVYIDELRISKGIARWTSNFTPEIGPYTT